MGGTCIALDGATSSLTPSNYLYFVLPPPLPLSISDLSTLPTFLSSFILHICPNHFNTPSSALSTTPLFHLHISLYSFISNPINPSQTTYRSQTFHLNDIQTFPRPSTYHQCFTPIYYRR